ncbi:hypothetical protein L9F63_017064 [Diploptera punctata]|uniref:Succinate dehydrogenase [ubiquinone] cytochrome b small subunit n=1 Tax=Diploptera punctata TaxID=6984 RepID=A0AAD8A090_DIPPU|nr:hypothetical protein L9F63_017064 [Diploptera punctata]
MAMSCVLRGASLKLRVSSLQSLGRSPILPCSSVIGSTQFHTLISQPLLYSKQVTKQNFPVITQNLPGAMMQKAKTFSLSPKNMSSHGHDHSKMWTIERAVAVSMLGIVPTAFLFPSGLMDTILAVVVVMHNHWGWEAVMVDYVRPSVFGTMIPKIAIGSVYALSIATLAGLMFFINGDVGIVNAIKMFWRL